MLHMLIIKFYLGYKVSFVKKLAIYWWDYWAEAWFSWACGSILGISK